ncbi:MAG: elongation factor P [Porphyrobacter sp.]|nr:elongation factor P [Porphyrobacter sp.]
MIMRSISLLIGLAAIVSVPAHAQGAIGTVQRGKYVCELPGDAAGSAGIAQPDLNFTIKSASRYSTAEGRGAYLRRGDVLTFTSGPRQGESFIIISPNFMRLADDGKPGRLRCVRSNR